jgi:hypothetical protein
MKALLYDVTSFTNPTFVKGYAHGFTKGYACETKTHFIHFWSYPNGPVTLQISIPITEQKQEGLSLEDWARKNFGAENLRYTSIEIGDSIDSVWRPSLYYDSDVFQAINTTLQERRLTEYSLRVLIEKMDDLFLYIEPDSVSMNTYSHKIRELLILACTEVETFWTFYLQKAGEPNSKRFTTNDYVKLKDKLFLNEYKFSLKSFASISPIKPFETWDQANPTESLPWYSAYNKTKHNRVNNFHYATFENALNAVIANLVLYIVRFGPNAMITQHGVFNTLVNQHFQLIMENTNLEFMYIPSVPFDILGLDTIFTVHNLKRLPIYEPFNVKPFLI